MEKLENIFEKIITEYTKAYDNDDPTAGGWAIFELLKAVKARDMFIIGEDEKLGKHDECNIYLDQGGWVCEDHHCWASDELGVARPERPEKNALKSKQRQRAKLTL